MTGETGSRRESIPCRTPGRSRGPGPVQRGPSCCSTRGFDVPGGPSRSALVPDDLELARTREAVEGRPARILREREERRDEVLEDPRVLQPARVDGLVSRVAAELVRDLARLVVAAPQVSGSNPLRVDLTVGA